MNSLPINGLNTPGNSVLSKQGGSFGDNPFLNLLVAEMRTQTPLDPVDNASFMEQMSSFSSMEEQRELNDNLLKLLDFQGLLARLQGLSESSALLGKQVSFTHEGQEQEGVVDSVFVDDEGQVQLRIGDKEISPRAITSISQPSAS
ncbi:MAG: flagellar hook capping FlgD N-terminal domain-containing protein [Planctomycetota bacterium]|jgi:flagellar basal-body rod modification protein FlgD